MSAMDALGISSLTFDFLFRIATKMLLEEPYLSGTGERPS
jgi:hypothetical protein